MQVQTLFDCDMKMFGSNCFQESFNQSIDHCNLERSGLIYKSPYPIHHVVVVRLLQLESHPQKVHRLDFWRFHKSEHRSCETHSLALIKALHRSLIFLSIEQVD